MNKWILICGALLGATAVMTGAFGAHALQSVLGVRAQGWYDTAVTYHAGHALAVLVTGILGLHLEIGGPCVDKSATVPISLPAALPPGIKAVRVAGASLVLGVLIFSGSLYVMAFTGITKLGMITPIGGVFLIIGWLSLALAASRIRTGVS